MSDMLKISRLADELLEAETAAEELTAKLEAATEKVNELRDVRIPAAMEEAGCKNFTAKNGMYLEVDMKLKCGNLKREDGLQWLRDHGHAGLIRSQVVVPFTVGQDDDARKLVADLAEKELAANHEAYVLWNSLAATVRGMLKEGEAVPLKTLGIHEITTTKVTKAKA